MCFQNDGKEFSNITDIVDITIPAKSSKIVTISENGTAGYIVASVGYEFNGSKFRRITYANGLKKTDSNYTLNTPQHNVVSVYNYSTVSSIPSYLKFVINGKTNGKWKVTIKNPNSYLVNVTYNSKMCTSSDAKDQAGCSDLLHIKISANSSKTVYISENFMAGYITARIDYYYHGFAYSKVTYANQLKTNSTSANESNHLVRHT